MSSNIGLNQYGKLIYGLSSSDIPHGTGNAQAYIYQPNPRQYGQAQARIFSQPCQSGQAQALVNQAFKMGQAQAKILVPSNEYENIAYSHLPLGYFPLDETSGDAFTNVVGTGDGTRTTGTITYSVNHALANAAGNTGISFGSGAAAKIDATIAGIPTATGSIVTVTGYIKLASGLEQMMFGWFVYEMYYPGSVARFGFNTGVGDVYGINPTSILDKWVHIAVVYYDNVDPNTSNKIYINGVNQPLTQFQGDAIARDIDNPFHFSGWGVDNSLWAKGTGMDTIGIYDRELSAGEILDQYNGGLPRGYGQAQALIIPSALYRVGQAQADILTPGFGSGQSQSDIKTQGYGSGQTQCLVVRPAWGNGQAQCDIKAVGFGLGQANASILGAIQQFGQAQADIKRIQSACGQAQCFILEEESSTCSPIFLDTFSRISSGNPGTPDLGPDYTSGGVSFYDNVTTDGDKLVLTETVESFDELDVIVDIPMADGEIQIDFKIVSLRDFATYASISRIYNLGQGQVRFTVYDAGTQANLELYWQSNSGVDQDIITVNLPDKLVVDTWYTAKLQIDGSTIRGKLWVADDPEPGAYDIELSTLIGDALVPGDRFYLYADTGDSETLEVVQYIDNLMICEMTTALTAGYGQANALICAQVYLDTFTRTFTGDPGTPDVGPDYAVGANYEVTNISADGSNLILTGNADYDEYYIYTPVNVADGEVTLDFYLDEIRNFATVFNFDQRVASLEADFPNVQFYGYYIPDLSEFEIWFNGGDTFPLFEVVTVVPETWYTAKFSFVGPNLKGKVWPRSDPEPDWQIEDTTSHLSAGIGYFFADVGEAGSYPATTKYDNFTLCTTSTVFIGSASGQAQTDIKATTNQAAQAQALIIKSAGYGQATADIKATRRGSGQAQCRVVRTQGYGQAQGKIIGHPTRSAQANALILKWAGYGQAQASIRVTFRGYGQAQTLLNRAYQAGQANADIKKAGRGYGQAQCFVGDRPKGYGQAQCYTVTFRGYRSGQATALINSSIKQGWGQAQCYVYNIPTGQAQALIRKLVVKSAQAQTMIIRNNYGWGQALALITTKKGHGQAQCSIRKPAGYGQAQTWIKLHPYASGQAQCLVNRFMGFGQAQCTIGTRSSGQAQAYIGHLRSKSGQAQAFIQKPTMCGQAQAKITGVNPVSGQAQAYIRPTAHCGQAQAVIVRRGQAGYGQAQTLVTNNSHSGQAQAMIDSLRYAVKYNGRFLTGYAFQEAYESPMEIYKSDPAYLDMTFAEYTGLKNKMISLSFKAWTNNSFVDSKKDVELATTIARSNRGGFVPLYIKDMSKHYLAMTKTIRSDNSVDSVHTYLYSVQFEAKPWLISDATNTITGAGSIDTDQVGRTIDNGGWTPARLVLSGSDITVSGYTITGQFTGFISVSGAVTNLEINSESYTAQIAGVNKNEVMRNLDYALYVGPDKTFFDVTGASSIIIEWEDRWYL